MKIAYRAQIVGPVKPEQEGQLLVIPENVVCGC